MKSPLDFYSLTITLQLASSPPSKAHSQLMSCCRPQLRLLMDTASHGKRPFSWLAPPPHLITSTAGSSSICMNVGLAHFKPPKGKKTLLPKVPCLPQLIVELFRRWGGGCQIQKTVCKPVAYSAQQNLWVSYAKLPTAIF